MCRSFSTSFAGSESISRVGDSVVGMLSDVVKVRALRTDDDMLL